MADKPILVRIPNELRQAIQVRADANDRSFSAEVRRTLRQTYVQSQPVEASR